MKKILSGIKPTGRPHIGNYFGMMRQLLTMQQDNQVIGLIVDYHALNFIQNAEEMRQLTHELVADYLALGFDTEKNILFKQSDISEHTELAWIFDTITTVPYLKRAHAYKDAVAKGGEEEVSAGTFTYPVLMAADILLYEPDLIPVGQDQKQHIEFARDIADKFNHIYGDTFKLPNEHIIKEVETVPGIDGRKMSKSYGNTIPLFATDAEIEKAVMSIVTDSSGERPENVFQIHRLLVGQNGLTSLTIDKLEEVYRENKGKYKTLKEILIDDLKKFITPIRQKREAIAEDETLIKKVLEEGKAKARLTAAKKMEEVKRAIGVI
jgi:tryptophanyl-tRNA synthetase